MWPGRGEVHRRGGGHWGGARGGHHHHGDHHHHGQHHPHGHHHHHGDHHHGGHHRWGRGHWQGAGHEHKHNWKATKFERIKPFRDQISNYSISTAPLGGPLPADCLGVLNEPRIAVFGPTGSGKSSFINTAERTIRETGSGTCNPQTLGSEGTIILEEFLNEKQFRLVDTRGFFSYNVNEVNEFKAVTCGQIRPGEEIVRSGGLAEDIRRSSIFAPFAQRVHSIVFVVSATDPRLTSGAFAVYITPMRAYMTAIGMSAVTVITHADELANQQACDATVQAVHNAIGSPLEHIYLLCNYTVANCERRPRVELTVLKVIHLAIINAEKFIANNYKQATSNAQEVEVVSTVGGTPNKYMVGSADTFGQLLLLAQRRYKLPNVVNYYFADKEVGGNMFASEAIISMALLQQQKTIYLCAL